MAEWIALSERTPEPKQAVLVKAEDWRLPRVLEYDEHPHQRLIDRMSGRFFWYPERMHWMPLLAASSVQAAPQQEPAQPCEWQEDDPNGPMPLTYASACGGLWSFIEGGPKENSVRFCHGCGKPVKVLPFIETTDAAGVKEKDHG